MHWKTLTESRLVIVFSSVVGALSSMILSSWFASRVTTAHRNRAAREIEQSAEDRLDRTVHNTHLPTQPRRAKDEALKSTAICGAENRSLLLFTTPKLCAKQRSTDRDSAWDPGSNQWGRRRMQVSSAAATATVSNTSDNGQTNFEREGGG
jgi:hypothetical protein